MTTAEIEDIKQRLCRLERLVYIAIGTALGSGALQLTQVIG